MSHARYYIETTEARIMGLSRPGNLETLVFSDESSTCRNTKGSYFV